MNDEGTQIGGTLFLSSTPLHTFFTLGLLSGPLREGPRRLWLINQPKDKRDFLADAIKATPSMGVQVTYFNTLEKTVRARAELRHMSSLVASIKPSAIAVGMDRRLEFHAAVRGWPKAQRIYMDDGLYSYIPHQHAVVPWKEWISNWRRSLKYGLNIEQPSLVGGSKAVQSAYVLLPEYVHAGLKNKPVQPFQPEWFAKAEVQNICITAALMAGLNATHCAEWKLLLLLPHPRFLSDTTLREQLAKQVLSENNRGRVALKSHPAAKVPAHQQLGIPAQAATEIPSRLPAEVLAPLLHNTVVVGALSTSLLTLSLLGRNIQVYRLPESKSMSSFEASIIRIYDGAGVKVLDESALILTPVSQNAHNIPKYATGG